jgi:hypothetical protein
MIIKSDKIETILILAVVAWFSFSIVTFGPPLWSSGQSFWLQIQRSQVRFPELPDFLRSSGSGTGSTQPREDNWGATWMEKQRLRVYKTEINDRGCLLRWPRDTRLSAKVGTNFANMRRSLGRYSSLADWSHGGVVTFVWREWDNQNEPWDRRCIDRDIKWVRQKSFRAGENYRQYEHHKPAT